MARDSLYHSTKRDDNTLAFNRYLIHKGNQLEGRSPDVDNV